MTEFLLARPILSASIAGFSLLDSVNCILLGHSDWYIPAFIALFVTAAFVNPQQT